MWREIEVTDGRRKKRERECEGPPGRPASRLDVCAGRLVLHISRRYYIHPRVKVTDRTRLMLGFASPSWGSST